MSQLTSEYVKKDGGIGGSSSSINSKSPVTDLGVINENSPVTRNSSNSPGSSRNNGSNSNTNGAEIYSNNNLRKCDNIDIGNYGDMNRQRDVIGNIVCEDEGDTPTNSPSCSPPLTPTPVEIQPLDSSPYKFSRMRTQKPSSCVKDKTKRSSFHEDMLHSYETESKTVQDARSKLYQSSIKKLKNSMWDANEKLFSDLLDDLDNISMSDTESAKKRKKARDLFSDWLFSQDAKSPENTARMQGRHSSDCAPATPRLRAQKSDPTIASKRRSTDLSDLDLRSSWRPRSFEYQSEEVRVYCFKLNRFSFAASNQRHSVCNFIIDRLPVYLSSYV